jgi:hypothetical protein
VIYTITHRHSTLWKRRARNKGLVVLKGKQAESYKKNNDKIKEGE